MELTGYYGTYSSPESRGVYRFGFDPAVGTFSGPALLLEAQNAKCLGSAAGALAAPIQAGERAGLVRFDRSGRELARNLFEPGTGCFLAEDADYLYSANYHEGTVTVCDRTSLAPLHRIEAGEKAGCHQVLLYGALVLVPCLERDEVRIYDKTQDFAQVGALTFAKGTGPRHGVFDAAFRRLFLVSERSNELFVFRVQGSDFLQTAEVPVAPGGASAAIRLSRDERFLYVSTREQELLTVFAVEGERVRRIQQVSCGGRHPRDFDLTPDGRWLLCLNRDEGGLVSFPVDPETGLLGAEAGRLAAPQGSGIYLER